MSALQKVDIGQSFAFVTKDAWFKKSAMAGLCMLIPVVGPFVLLGWQRRCFECAREGAPMPDVDFGGDIGRGFSVFIAMFTTILPVVFLGACGGIPLALLNDNAGSDDEQMIVAAFAALFGLFMAVVLLAFQPQWRGQPTGTFRTVFNALLYGSEVGAATRATPGFWSPTPIP